ncbi:MAG: hypothetical protein K5683_00545 [Prevotella sp.]|nr:hypothetical protein [Prevotella sp.]
MDIILNGAYEKTPAGVETVDLGLFNIEYVNPYNGKKMSVMLRTDYDEEVTKLLDAIGVKP